MAWTPLDLGATLTGWWDFSDATTLYEDTGATDPVDADADLILRANNKAGASYNATEATNPPTYKTGIRNGLSVARFDGSNDQLIANSTKIVTGANTSTIIAVTNKLGNVGDKVLYSENVGLGPVLFLLCRAGKAQFSVYNGSWSDAVTAAAIADGWHIVVGWQDSAVATRVYVDGVAGNAGAGRPTSAASGNTYIGNVQGTGRYNSDIGEVLVCDTALSVANLNLLGAYLAAKWGLTWTDVS